MILKYKIKDLKIDLGTTPIENIFINNYLQIADGDDVKVYLYAYKLAYEGKVNEMPSEEELAVELGMDTDRLLDAFNYWQDQGLISIEEEGDSKSYHFLSLRELFLGVREPAKPVDDFEILSNDDDITMTNKEMFTGIEEILDTVLTPNEIERILDLKKEFRQDRDLIVHGFTYSEKTTGKRNVNYVLTILRNWALDGILTMADFEKHEAENEKRQDTKNTKKKRTTKKKQGRTDDRISSEELRNILDRKLRADVEKAMGGDIEDK